MRYVSQSLSILLYLRLYASAQVNITAPFTNLTISSNNGTKPFWLEHIKHQGLAAFRNDSTYQVFRNVKDFGAKGDGKADDTAAINLAIRSSVRCGPGSCQSSTTSPAIVYFPAGTYRISSPIINYYYTQIIGNPNNLPVIKGVSNFTAFALIDGNQYQPGNVADPAGSLGFNATNVFYRQIKNLILDTTSISPNVSVNGIHWPTAQATSLQNLVFRMSDVKGTQHQGILIESGSGGFMSDLVFHGGLTGAVFGNQQFTSRNLSFYNAVTAINQIFDWGWTYKSIRIFNCSLGLNMTSGGSLAQTVGSVTLLDSSFKNTPVGILTAYNTNFADFSNGSLILENINIHNVGTVVQGLGNMTSLGGSLKSQHIPAWGRGHLYNPDGPYQFNGMMSPFSRPAGLVDNGNKYYERSKPSYAEHHVSQFLSARSYDAKGDGVSDDTAALQRAIHAATQTNKILFVDAGTYRVTDTIFIPKDSKIVGESYPVIMSSGPFFSKMSSPKPVVQVGKAGHIGVVEWSDMIVATQGPQAGAVLIEWNLESPSEPSGMWDVHTRIGGFAGSHLQLANCPVTPAILPKANHSNGTAASRPSGTSISSKIQLPGTARPLAAASIGSFSSPFYSQHNHSSSPEFRNISSINDACVGAFMSMHITPSASNLYIENVWLWTADHDLDSTFTNISIYSGRGLLVESRRGNIWLVGTSVEHHALYQYQFVNTHNVFAGQMQTETAYWQPHPDISSPFQAVDRLHDPTVREVCKGKGNCDGLGIRLLDSRDLNLYGVGLYSFFDDYDLSCSNAGNGETCQRSIFSIEGKSSSNVNVYNLNTVGATSMIDRDDVSLADSADNVDVFPDNIAIFRLS